MTKRSGHLTHYDHHHVAGKHAKKSHKKHTKSSLHVKVGKWEVGVKREHAEESIAPGGVNEVTGSNGVVTTSGYKYKRHRKPMLLKVLKDYLPRDRYLQNFVIQLLGQTGNQQCSSYTAMGSVSDLFGICFKKGYTSELYGGFQMLVENMEAEFMMTNADNFTAFVDIYDYEFKYPSSRSSYSTTVSYDDTTFSALWDNEQDMYGGQAPAGTTMTYYGTHPSDSNKFRTYIKVNRVTRVTLNPGCTHRHTSNAKGCEHKIIVGDLINRELNKSSTGQFMKGVTKGFAFVYHGIPIQEIATSTNVSLSSPVINIVGSIRYDYRFLERVRPIQIDFGTSAITNKNVTKTTLKGTLEETGASAADTSAV